MVIRGYREEDLPELVDLWNEAHRGDYEFIPYTQERVRERLERASSILLAVDEQAKVLGLATLSREWFGEEVELHIRPVPSRWEIEGRLLSAIEREAQTDRLTVIADAEDQERIELLAARGYKLQGSFYHMAITLEGLRPVPPVPSGYRLRGLRPDEEEALIRAVNTAYEGERLRPGVLARWQEEDPDFSPEWIQVAEHEGELVAAVVARSDREFNLHYGAKRAYLGPAATLPKHRGKGLNKALTVRALNLLRERGFKTASLYTWSGNHAALKVLRSTGFQVSHEWRILGKNPAAKEMNNEKGKTNVPLPSAASGPLSRSREELPAPGGAAAGARPSAAGSHRAAGVHPHGLPPRRARSAEVCRADPRPDHRADGRAGPTAQDLYLLWVA